MMLYRLSTDIHGPETAIARGVLQEVACIGRAKEYAPPGKFFDVAAIGGTVAVRAQAQKLLYAGDIGTPERIKLSYLYQPYALQQLGCLLALKGAD